MKLIDNFISELNVLKGKECWGIIAGKGTGHNVSIQFGEKILRKNVIPNDYLSDDQRMFKPEFSLFIESSWRLDSIDKVICSSDDPNDNNGLLVNGLKNIVNKKILSIEVLKPALDLVIEFSDLFFLKIFCDHTDPNYGYDNYSFFMPEKIYIIGTRSSLYLEDRLTD